MQQVDQAREQRHVEKVNRKLHRRREGLVTVTRLRTYSLVRVEENLKLEGMRYEKHAERVVLAR